MPHEASYTGYHAVAASVPAEDVQAELEPADAAAPMNPTFLGWLGRRLEAVVGHVDVVLAGFGTGRPDGLLEPRSNPPDNERVRRARGQRSNVDYLVDHARQLVVTIGEGLCGRAEISIEVANEQQRGIGIGSAAVRSAMGHIAPDRPVFCQRCSRQHSVAARVPDLRLSAHRRGVLVHRDAGLTSPLCLTAPRDEK